MPVFEIGAPDGKKYRINAPEGTTKDQAMVYFQSNWKGGQAAPQADFSDVQGSVTVGSGSAETNRANKRAQRNGVAGQVTDFLDATQHHVLNAPIGIGQFASHGLNAGIQAVAGGSDFAKNAQKVMLDTDRQIAQREKDYQDRTPDSAGAYTGAVVGEVLPWMVGVGEMRALGLLPKASTALGKAAALSAGGAIQGAAIPVTDGNYAGQKAAQIGIGAVAAPAIAGGGKLAAKGAGAVRDTARLATPTGRQKLAETQIGKMLADAGADPALLRAPQPIPGFNLSIDQANPSPEMIQLATTLRNKYDTAPAFAQLHADQNKAALDAIQGVAGDDAALSAARQARSAESDAFRNPNLPAGKWDVSGQSQAGSAMIPTGQIEGQLSTLAQHPNTAVSGAAKTMLGKIRAQSKANGGAVDAYYLDALEQEVGRTLRAANLGQNVPATVSKNLDPIKTSLVDTIDAGVPGYRDYLETYARNSQPINDMETGSEILRRLSGRGLDVTGNQNINLSDVRTALAKNDGAEFGLSPSAEKQVQDTLRALQVRSISNNKVAAAGPGTAAGLDALMSTAKRFGPTLGIGGVGAAGGGFLGPLGAIAGGVIGAGVAEGRRDVAKRVGKLAVNAPESASALEALLRGQQRNPRLSRLQDILLPYQSP